MASDRKIVQLRLTPDVYALWTTVKAHHDIETDVGVIRFLLAHEARRIEDYNNSRPKPRKPRKSANSAE